jgi:hypothetical protein
MFAQLRKAESAQILMAELFIIAKSWSYFECLSVGLWLTELWCIHSIKYYPGIQIIILELSNTKNDARCIDEWGKSVQTYTKASY